MAIVIDGITLPEFPEGEMEFQFETITTSDFPHRAMVGFGPLGEAYNFWLVATKSPIIHIPEELIGIEAFMQMEAGYFLSQCMFRVDGEYNDGPIWFPYEAHSDEQFGAGVGTTISSEVFKTIFWSNYDIKTAIAVNEDTMEVTTGDEIYFPNSETPAEPEPEYGKIRRAIIRGASNAVRRKTGRTDKFPPEQLESEIDSIVTADGLPVAEDNVFGALLTGKYFYGTYQTALAVIPSMGFPYVFLRQYNGNVFAYLSTVQFEVSNYAGNLYPKETGEYCYLQYDFNSDTWGVKQKTTTTSGMTLPNDVLWTNHNICNNTTGEVVHAATTPVVSEESVFEYVEVEDFYLIRGDTLNTLTAIIQQITISSASTPSEAEAALKIYAATH